MKWPESLERVHRKRNEHDLQQPWMKIIDMNQRKTNEIDSLLMEFKSNRKKHIQTDITLQTETEWDAPMNPNWKKKFGGKKAIPNVFGLIESNEE